MHVPDELLNVYLNIIRQTSDNEQAKAHLQNLILDAAKISETVDALIEQANQRAGLAQAQ